MPTNMTMWRARSRLRERLRHLRQAAPSRRVEGSAQLAVGIGTRARRFRELQQSPPRRQFRQRTHPRLRPGKPHRSRRVPGPRPPARRQRTTALDRWPLGAVLRPGSGQQRQWPDEYSLLHRGPLRGESWRVWFARRGSATGPSVSTSRIITLLRLPHEPEKGPPVFVRAASRGMPEAVARTDSVGYADDDLARGP